MLAAIRDAFAGGTEHALTSEILRRLNDDPEAPWCGYNKGDGITARDVAKHLGKYGLESKNIKIGGETLRGYGAKTSKRSGTLFAGSG